MVDSSLSFKVPRAVLYCSFAIKYLGTINKINKMYALLEQSNERPSAEEIAKESSRHDSKKKNSGRHLSMDAKR
jgi:hypothetical protein